MFHIHFDYGKYNYSFTNTKEFYTKFQILIKIISAKYAQHCDNTEY